MKFKVSPYLSLTCIDTFQTYSVTTLAVGLFVCLCVCAVRLRQFFFSNVEMEYLDILSIGIIKSCLLELILADWGQRNERGLEREIDKVRESERAVMSAP